VRAVVLLSRKDRSALWATIYFHGKTGLYCGLDFTFMEIWAVLWATIYFHGKTGLYCGLDFTFMERRAVLWVYFTFTEIRNVLWVSFYFYGKTGCITGSVTFLHKDRITSWAPDYFLWKDRTTLLAPRYMERRKYITDSVLLYGKKELHYVHRFIFMENRATLRTHVIFTERPNNVI
jgi:hypothetical protein